MTLTDPSSRNECTFAGSIFSSQMSPVSFMCKAPVLNGRNRDSGSVSLVCMVWQEQRFKIHEGTKEEVED